ncbi:DUF3426 domain-containing protein [Pseudoduganella violaceinigra]|uniref:DUF3426 domain-containing protein n=1 Tax=Pseudoduganella violaceinigra TaxID=246602 RepID=UPI0003FEF661|nr:DUF3426 domain-containing protein [Pseudoduganella violaceinigra]
MALATKCPHCSTIFRVAADQLKLRGGIVRCGSCSQVFDGNAALVEPAAKPTPVIPDVAADAGAPHAAVPAISDYVHGSPVDFELELDFAEAPKPAIPQQRTAAPATPAQPSSPPPAPLDNTPRDEAPAPAVWRSTAAAPPQAPAAPAPSPADAAAQAAVARAFAHATTPPAAPATPMAEKKTAAAVSAPAKDTAQALGSRATGAPSTPAAAPAVEKSPTWEFALPDEAFLAAIADEKPAPLGEKPSMAVPAAPATPAARPPAEDKAPTWSLVEPGEAFHAAFAAEMPAAPKETIPPQKAAPAAPLRAEEKARPSQLAQPGAAFHAAFAAEMPAPPKEVAPPPAPTIIPLPAGPLKVEDVAPASASAQDSAALPAPAADIPAEAAAGPAPAAPIAPVPAPQFELEETALPGDLASPAEAFHAVDDADLAPQPAHLADNAPPVAEELSAAPAPPLAIEEAPAEQPAAHAAPEAAPDAGQALVAAIEQWSADHVAPDGRIEPSFGTPHEPIFLAVPADSEQVEHLSLDEPPDATPPSAETGHAATVDADSAGEPSLDEQPWSAVAIAPEPASPESTERDDTALHAIAAVNTDVPDDGASLPEDAAPEPAPESRRERALKRMQARRNAIAQTPAEPEEAPPAAAEPSSDTIEPVEDSAQAAAARMRALAGVDEHASAEIDHSDLSFVKRVERRQRYGRAMNTAMAIGIPFLLAGLALQAGTTFRDTLAANYPQLKPVLIAMCEPLDCKIALPTQLEALSIEQGELAGLAENTFSFATVLRNQSKIAQAWPHIELILNDSADKPVLRRVFSPQEYLADATEVDKGFGPRTEQSIKLYFELKELKASGYHIAIFYP